MDQIQRDLTYRAEAVRLICEKNGYESQICQESMERWESQHSMNVYHAKLSFYGGALAFVVGLIVFGFFLYYQFLKFREHKTRVNK